MDRRRFLAGAGATGVGLLLGGCAQSSKTPPSTVAFFNDVPTWSPGFARTDAPLKRRAGTILAPQSVPGTSSYQQVIQSQLQTRNPPDIHKWGSGFRMQDLARTGNLHPLDDVWRTITENGWASADTKAMFDYKGHSYGIPLVQGFYVLFYSVKVFKRLGLTRPTTWKEFTTACEALKKAGITPIGATQVNSFPVAYWMSPLAVAVDADWYDKVCHGKASFLDAPGRQMMEIWADMIKKGWFTSPDVADNDFPAMVAKEQIGMYVNAAAWGSQALEATSLGKDGFDCFILPPVDGTQPKATIAETAGLLVPKRAPHLDQALKVADQWMAPDVQKQWASFLNGSTANPKVTWVNRQSQRIQKQVADNGIKILNRYYEASPPALVDGNLQDLGGFMANPSDPVGVLESLQQRAETEWKYWEKVTA